MNFRSRLKKKHLTIAAVLLIPLLVILSKAASDKIKGDKKSGSGAALTPGNGVALPVTSQKQSDGSMKHTLTYKANDGKTYNQAISEKERSVVILARAFSEFSKPGRKPDELKDYLKSFGLKPLKAIDGASGIADFVTMRTRNSLPGLRYIHIQYDDLGKDDLELQLFSFELPKGPGALNNAVDLVSKATFLGTEIKDTMTGLRMFKNGEYIYSFRELLMEDLRDSRYNAYEAHDVGTIRVSMQLDPHEAEHEH